MSSSAIGSHANNTKIEDVVITDLWAQALDTLNVEDRKMYHHGLYDPLSVLKKVCGMLNRSPECEFDIDETWYKGYSPRKNICSLDASQSV